MTSLNNLLNPESSYEYNLRIQQSRSPSSSTSSPLENAAERPVEDYYGGSSFTITSHEPHPNCPDTLTCLPDTDGRPQHTLPVILRCAILGSPKKRLTIREIYAAMEKKYPYYKTAGPAWKQSVRHHLSLNRLFERQPRPATDPGFGSYWTVNLDAPPGTKRPRKRGRASSNKDNLVNGNPVVDRASTPTMRTPIAGTPHPPIPGLPPNPPVFPKIQEKSPEREYHPPPPPPPIATLRPVDSRSFSSNMSSRRPREYYDDDDDDDDEMDWDDDGPRASDGYPSSDETPYQYDPRSSAPSSSHTPSTQSTVSRPALYGAFSGGYTIVSHTSRGPSESQEPVVDRLKLEMAGLRRPSADAVSASLRLSSQLSEAQADVARARAALKVAETRLEEEIRRRREAEHIAEDEARLRLAAEDALRAYQLQRRPPGYVSRP